MGLPKIKHPVFDEKIPSTGKTLTLRPFTVREEKILLMAQTSEDIADMVKAIKQVLNNCIVVGETDNLLEKIATFDIEYLFIKLRSKSVGEIVEVNFIEKNSEDKEVKYTAEINLDDVNVTFPEDHSKNIKFTDTIGITMKYPTFDQIVKMEQEGETADGIFGVFLGCVENVYDENGVYIPDDDFTPKELEEFILDLDTGASEKIANFFDTMPSLEHVVTARDSKGNEKEYTLKGLSDFFML
jgi:hypothetical protein